MPTKTPGLTEAHVEQTVTEFLAYDGWRSFKMEANSERGYVQRVRLAIAGCPALNHVRELIFGLLKRCMRAAGVGEPGMPDRLFIRYGVVYAATDLGIKVDGAELWVNRRDEAMWIEFKKPGEKPRADQIAWHEAERARGALVLVVSDIDDFMRDWYPKSGLMRRELPRVEVG